MDPDEQLDWLLQPGHRLGPYRIDARLGSGGMGQVYKATDTRLHRLVAIKVLPDVRVDAQLRQRFEREARAIAALRHPHVCVLHDVGQERGLDFLVMEFLEGESLAQRLTAGPLPLDQVERYAADIADALATIHRHGIVHRDVKPANVMLTPIGATLLDFGTVRVQQAPDGARGISSDVSTLTGAQMIVGTLNYMAPEQLEGKAVDARADIFAFGAVVYEMVTGRRAFEGSSQASVVAAIMERDPEPFSKVGIAAPPALERLILKCLRKNPEERWQRADDIVSTLRPLITTPGRRSVRLLHRPRWHVGAAVPTALLLVAIAGSVLMWRNGRVSALFAPHRSSRSDADVTGASPRIVIENLRQLTTEEGVQVDPAISPDGKFVAYSAGDAAHLRIFIRPMAGGRAIPLSDDNDTSEVQPRWSPDGAQILYLDDYGAFVRPAFGGSARRIDANADAPTGALSVAGPNTRVTGAAWSPDGRRVAIAYGGALTIAPLDGSEPPRLVTTANDELHDCDWSPNGKWIACVIGNWQSRTYWGFGDGGGAAVGNVAPSGIGLVSATGGTMIAVADVTARNYSPAWTADSRRLYFVSNRAGGNDIFAVDLADDGHTRGQPIRTTTGLRAFSIAAAADGQHLAYAAYAARSNVWSLPIPARGPIDTSAAEQITRGDQIIEFMRVSADNKWLLYDSTLYGNADIFRMPLEGGPAERLTTDPADEFAPDLSSDGRWLVYHSFRTKSRDIFVKPMDGGPIEQVTGTPAHESYPVWLPDGSLLFFDQLFKDGVPGGYFTVRSGGSRNWGSPVALDVSRRVYSLRWLRDNRVAYVRDLQNDIPSGRFQIEVKSLTSGETRILYRGTSEDDPRPEVIDVDEEEHRIYFKSHDASGRAEFWTLPLSGGRPRLLVKFSDPARQSRRYEFDAAAGRFYFAVDERRSNIWIADIAAK